MIILVRHATTEGGDGHAVVDEGLSDMGRQEAAKLKQGFPFSNAQVLSSHYLRCKETAEIVFGESSTWWPLATLAGLDGKERYERTKVLLDYIGIHAGSGSNLVLVTHRRNIYWLIDEEFKPAEWRIWGNTTVIGNPAKELRH